MNNDKIMQNFCYKQELLHVDVVHIYNVVKNLLEEYGCSSSTRAQLTVFCLQIEFNTQHNYILFKGRWASCDMEEVFKSEDDTKVSKESICL